MGAWGTAIFSDDFACDVRDDYLAQLIHGKTNDEAIKFVMEQHYLEVKGSEEEPVFWFALALTQWKKERLVDEVKKRALEFIENGSDLVRWNETENEKNYTKRAKVLEGLKETLLSPMPKAKKIPKPPWIWTSPWQAGALLTYKLVSNHIDLKEYLGKYVLLRVVEVIKHNTSGLVSVNLGTVLELNKIH